MVVNIRRHPGQPPIPPPPAPSYGPSVTQPPEEGAWAEQISYEQLKTGHEGGRAYARVIDQTWVSRLAREWDENKLDSLHVSLDPDGELVVICGNHRLLGARKRGVKGYKFWCMVYAGLTLEEEAQKFYALDHNRKLHTVRDGYKASMIFKDPRTVAVDAVLQKYGFTVSEDLRPSRQTAVVRSVAALYKAYDYDGLDLFDRGVGVILDAWGHNAEPKNQPTLNGYTIEAMVAFLWRYEMLPQFDRRKLVRAMQHQEQRSFGLSEYHALLQKLRADHQRLIGSSGNSVLRFGMEALVRLYNRKRQLEFRLPARWVSISRTLVKAEREVYLKEGLTGDTPDNNL